jgi:hypothetical protein
MAQPPFRAQRATGRRPRQASADNEPGCAPRGRHSQRLLGGLRPAVDLPTADPESSGLDDHDDAGVAAMFATATADAGQAQRRAA